MIKGRDIIIAKGGTAIACVKTSNIQVSTTTYDLCPKTNETDWENLAAGKKSWGFSTSWLLSAVSDLDKVLEVGYVYSIHIYHRNSSSYLYGSALCTQCEIEGNVESLARGSFAFKGVGALKKYTPSS